MDFVRQFFHGRKNMFIEIRIMDIDGIVKSLMQTRGKVEKQNHSKPFGHRDCLKV